MFNDRCVLFFGVRVELSETEVELCELRMHPLMIKARDESLQNYWSNFDLPGEKYFLFVGKLIGIVGREDDSEVRVSPDVLNGIITFTTAKLSKAGIEGEPALFMQRQPT
jgi:hypothetical protein